MEQENFVKPLLDNVNSFYRVGLKQFSWYKKIQGTRCLVTRTKSTSKYQDVFGTVVSSTLHNDPDKEEFPYVVLINMNDMQRLYQESINQLDFYDNEDTLQLGDVITFSRGGLEFKFKIIEVKIFSEVGGVLNQFTISGLKETKSH